MNVWVFTVKFPNAIQPWLANLVSQIPKNGGDVKIFALTKGDIDYNQIVDQYQLTDKTEYLKLFGFNNLISILSNFLNPKKIASALQGVITSANVKSKHKGNINNLISKLTLAPYLAKGGVDIIHSHSEATGHKLLPIVKAQGVPFVITFHGLPPHGVKQLSSEMRAEYTDAASVILVNTEFAKRQYAKLCSKENKIRILPQGIDTKHFKFKTKSFPQDGVLRILTVGRYSKEKGQVYAIEAIANLIKKGYLIEYTLIGAGPDKPRLQLFINELGIEKFVTIRSTTVNEELVQEYQKAHIYILPSLCGKNANDSEETQGVTIQEAQACGALVIATRTGGIPECVLDGESAFLVNDRDSQAIEEKIEWVINKPEKWPYWQEKARLHVEQNYDIDIIGQKMMGLYKELVEKN